MNAYIMICTLCYELSVQLKREIQIDLQAIFVFLLFGKLARREYRYLSNKVLSKLPSTLAYYESSLLQ